MLKRLMPGMSLAWLLAIALAGSASAATCPNEAIRASLHSVSLPECRAYELVSPAVKNGWQVEVPNVSLDGEQVLATSLGGFAGSTQTRANSFYDLTRTPGGWLTSPFIEPPGFINTVFDNLQAATPNLDSGLFEYRPSSTADPRVRRFYIRDLPDGSPVEVGPVFSTAALNSNPLTSVGRHSEPSISADFKHILFTIEGPSSLSGPHLNYLWPEDGTIENVEGPAFTSLYEYVGTGNSKPSLVGVNDAGQQISQCGTSLGFPPRGHFIRFQDEELYNAISADGSRVFFTAAAACEGGAGPAANELFARTDSSKTTSISEPSSGATGDCSECDTSEPAAAVFQGASEDGSKVFFLSEQRLLPGSEGQNLYEYDFDAIMGKRLVLVAPAVAGVARVSEDGSRVYFVSQHALTVSPNPVGAVAQSGGDNLFVYDTPTKSTAFVGELSPADEEDWQRADERPVDATKDGRFIAFTSSADLTPDDTSTSQQVFEYDALEKTLIRVSAGREGFNQNGNTDEYPARIVFPSYDGRLNPAPQPTSISADGAYVVFQSRDNLTPHALAGYNNVYEFHDGQVSLISDGRDVTVNVEDNSNVALVGVDASGANVFFITGDQLVPQDGDTQTDLYDARINGGFPPPAEPKRCEGDGCQGGLAPLPPLSTALSPSQPAGEGVVEPPVKVPVKTKTKHKTKKTKPKKKAHRGHKARRTAQQRGKRK